MDQLIQTVGLLLSACAGVGWIFKVWIINPLSASITQLNKSLDKMDAVIGNIQHQSLEFSNRLAVLESSLKSAHKRIDDFHKGGGSHVG